MLVGPAPKVVMQNDWDFMVVILLYSSFVSVSFLSSETRYGMDSPGIETRCGRVFPQPSIPTLWPTQPPIQWVSGHSWI
jgi:hypothetical protein